jgi:DNA modification methylase
VTVTIHQGDCRDVLALLPSGSVNCIVTSPPYFGLRDYGVDSQIGMEETPSAFVDQMVSVFRASRRVLRDDGTLWLNLGDSYAGSWGARGRGSDTNAARPDLEAKHGTAAPNRNGYAPWGVKSKDLMGIPWRVALALQADGWYLRQDIIWHKPNPMPESIRDRCTKAHEYIFLLSKSERYHFDCDAIKTEGKGAVSGNTQHKYVDGDPRNRTKAGFIEMRGKTYAKVHKRSVWTVTTKPFKEAHFATFPPDLIEPCVLAGCPADGVVLDPFFGAGTTGLVAQRNGRDCIGIELNPEYIAIANKRLGLPTVSEVSSDGGVFD